MWKRLSELNSWNSVMGLFDRFSRTFDKHGYDLDGYDKDGYDRKE